MRSGRPRGPGKGFKNVGGEAPHIFEGFPVPPGPARPQKFSQQIPARLPSARLPSGTQLPAFQMFFVGFSVCTRSVFLSTVAVYTRCPVRVGVVAPDRSPDSDWLGPQAVKKERATQPHRSRWVGSCLDLRRLEVPVSAKKMPIETL